jgi:hypothetical protein
MGVGLYLSGRYEAGEGDKPASPDEWLGRIGPWLDEDLDGERPWGDLLIRVRWGQAHEQHPALFVSLHPAAEEVEVFAPEPGRVVVSATTSAMGPGYHIALCELLHRMGNEHGIV